jgi:hypothetical protein
VNDATAAPLAADPATVYALVRAHVPLVIDAEAAGDASLPPDHPPWQRDVVSLSSRARAMLASIVPRVVTTLSYWDQRVRQIVLGARTVALDAAGCYRLR